MIKYKLIIEWSEIDQAYLVEVPELAGCKADGETYQQAVINAEQVIIEWLETAKKLGKNIPESSNVIDSKNLDTKQAIRIVFLIVIGVISFYFANFYNFDGFVPNYSKLNGDWGTFGDYVGGILNPIIAGFAFYLIAKTYDLQKKELEATRDLLKDSTDAQAKQVKLAALTALFNSKLMKAESLESQLNRLYEIIRENKLNELMTDNIEAKDFLKDQNLNLHGDRNLDGMTTILNNKIELNEKEISELEKQIKCILEE